MFALIQIVKSVTFTYKYAQTTLRGPFSTSYFILNPGETLKAAIHVISFPQGFLSRQASDSLCIVSASYCLKYSFMGPQYITCGRKMTLPPNLLSLCGGLIHSS